MEYLTERSLGGLLAKIFPNKEIIHNKKVPNTNCNFRPDYRIEDEKLIIEFNGYRHYEGILQT